MEGGSVGHRDVSLRTLLSAGEIVGADDIRVTHCATDSRSCREGDLFVALADEHADGHDFIRDAAALGAKAVVASRPVETGGVPVCYVPDTRVAYGQICQALAGDPSRRLKTIGIASAFGKTTTACLTASVLTAAKRPTGILGSLGYSDGVELSDARWTTPPPNVLAAWLARAADNGCSHAIAEISGRGLMEDRLAGVSLDCLCVTNSSSGQHDSAAADCRRTAARMLSALAPEGALVVNADDPAAAALVDRHSGPVLTVALDAPAELSASVVERHRSEQTFLLSFGDETIPVRTSLIGPHNTANCLSAAAIGLVYGIDPATIVRGLEQIRDVPGRLERVECGQPFGVFIDEGLSPDALETCLASLRTVTEGRLTCVFNAAAKHQRGTRARLGRVVDRWCDRAILTACRAGMASRDTAPILADVATGFRDAEKCAVVADRADAVRRALQAAEPGDCVLIAGQSLEAESFDDRKQSAWDDRQLARQLLYQLSHAEPLPTRRAA